jgi:hypothetical protein
MLVMVRMVRLVLVVLVLVVAVMMLAAVPHRTLDTLVQNFLGPFKGQCGIGTRKDRG